MFTRSKKAVFGSTEFIAINDTNTMSRQKLRGFALHNPLKRAERTHAVLYKFDGNIGFEIVEFVIHGLDRNVNVVLMSLVGMMDGGGGFEDNFEHECHERGEEEASLILLFGGLIEETVELVGREESLQGGADEDGEGGFLFKMFEDLIVGVHIDSFQRSVGRR